MSITLNAAPGETRFIKSYHEADAVVRQSAPDGTTVSVSPVIAEVFTHLQTDARSKDIMLINNTFQQVNVPISKNIIHTMIHNLVSNSIKFANAGRVDVSCEESRNWLTIMVKDQGIGMDSTAIDSIMQARAFSENESPAPAASTTGLMMIHAFLHQLCGSMTIDSIPGKGTTVQLHIPVSLS